MISIVRHKHVLAFTLLELLIVILILGVLLAIVTPSLARAGEKARVVRCATNLRQITVLMSAYATENQGRLPYQAVELEDWSAALVENYGAAAKVFRCPEDNAPRRAGYEDSYLRSYAVNNALSLYDASGLHAPWPSNRTRPADLLNRVPPTVILLGENENGGYVSGAVVGIAEGEGLGAAVSISHHRNSPNRGGNYAYADGHVEFAPYSIMSLWFFESGTLGDPWKWTE